MNWTTLLLSGRGRINRLTLLLGLLPVVLLLALVLVHQKYLTGLLPHWADIALSSVITLEALYFLACLAAKRMHDYDRPAHFLWLLFSPLILAVVMIVQQKYFPLPSYNWAARFYIVAICLVVLAFLWMMVEMLFRRGDEHENRFGAVPRQS